MMRFDKTRAYTETSKCLIKPISYDSDYVYMRPEVNSNRFEISLRGKISFRCKVTWSEMSNRSEFSI